MSRVRELSDLLVAGSKNAKVNRDRAYAVAQALKEVPLEIPTWDFPPFYPQTDDFEEMCLFYLVFNSINYCYFDQDYEKFYDGEHGYSGSTLAGYCLTEMWDEIKDPQFLANVDETFLLGELFAADVPISMVKERTEAIREVGNFLLKNTDFTFDKFFQKHHRDAYRVSQAIPVILPTWRDPFAKRAQLFVGMVHGKFQNREEPVFDPKSLRDLTVFADYRVPQTLIAMGIIEVSALHLLSRINAHELVAPCSRMELELRAATVVGADVLTQALDEMRDEEVNVLHTDFLLWSAARKRENMPAGVFVNYWPNHHLTITTDY